MQNATPPCGGNALSTSSHSVSDFNRSSFLGPIPLMARRSSHWVNDLLPVRALAILSARTGPMPGSRMSESGGAVERNRNGLRRYEEGADGDSVAAARDVRFAGDGDGPQTCCRSHVLGTMNKRMTITAPAVRFICTSTLEALEAQLSKVQVAPYTKVVGVIKNGCTV